MEKNNTDKKDEIGSNWNLGADLGSGVSASVTWNMGKGHSKSEMNAEFDKMRLVFSRQQARSCILTCKQKIERLIVQEKSVIDTVARLDEKGHLSVAERQQREGVLLNLESLKTTIATEYELLKEFTKEAE